MNDQVKAQVFAVNTVLSLFREQNPHATCAMAQAFMTIATNPGMTIGDVQKAMHLPPTATSRAVGILMEKTRGREGLGLVRYELDDYDQRVKHLFLTSAGERLWKKIEKAFTKEYAIA